MYLKFFAILVLVIFFAAFGVVLANVQDNLLNQDQQLVSPNFVPIEQPSPSPIPSPKVEVGTPVRLQIPKLQVNAVIEPVGLDAQGRMDVPKLAENVAWYTLGASPGETGNAVLAGHLDRSNGAPAVFYYLNQLVAGDEIIVNDDLGNQYRYKVTTKAVYPYNDFPLEEIFGETNRSQLNLITCQGSWDSFGQNYSHRTVVSAELIQTPPGQN